MKIIFLVFSSILILKLNAQPLHLDIQFQDVNSGVFDFALTGGLNNPQYSEIDLDGDNIKDLVYFDRVGDVVVTFLNGGTANTVDYTYAPEYIYRFPKVENWMLLRDYNCDLLEDLFAYKYDTNTGKVSITVYEASRDGQNKVQFTLVKNIIEFHLKGQSTLFNLANSTVDLPAVDDIDGDGDMDILNFNSSGGYIEMFKNESQELGFGCDSLLYVFNDNCWGRMYESGVSEFIDLSPVIDSCAGYPNWNPIKSARHSGSTILTVDMDNDGDKELFLGDLSFKNINMLSNGGNADTAHLTAQEMFFPQNSTNINIDIFPAAFYVDVNNDAAPDLLAAPNILANSEDDKTWYYENTGSATFPVFSHQQNDFLVNEMLDLGTGSAPAFFDFNSDGLMDIVVGNGEKFINTFLQQSYLSLYENIGTASFPVYKLADSDFASIKQYNQLRLVPNFGDLDNDGDQDMIIGLESGELFYVANTGTATVPNFPNIVSNYAGIDVGQKSSPQLVDADRDGDLDLIVGERNGNINYFENTGTASAAVFSSTATTETFGFIDAKLPGTIEGNSAPHLIDYGGKFFFFVGNEAGEIWQYNDVDSNLSGTFNRVNDVLDSIDVGEESVPAISNINNNGFLEILVGNKRGGLQLFSESFFVPVTSLAGKSNSFNIFPNPTNGSIKIEFFNVINEEVSLQITNLLGQVLILQTLCVHKEIDLNLTDLPQGTFILSVQSGKDRFVKKIIRI
jgi:hypothetical protein